MEIKVESNENHGMAVYEVSYLLLPFITDSEVLNKVATLKNLITKSSGEIISDENPVLIDLAYRMTKVSPSSRHKADSGYFGWIKFELPKDETSILLPKIIKGLDDSEDVLRYLIVKTVRENTLLNGKMMLIKEEKVRKSPEDEFDGVDEGEKEVPAEEIDKSIDDLVIA